MNAAIFLAEEIKTNTGNEIPRQYTNVAGRTMAFWAICPMLACASVDNVVVVAEAKWRDQLIAELRAAEVPTAYKIRGFAEPGDSRQVSILNGIREVLRGGCSVTREADTILIHDAARPYIRPELLDALYAAYPGNDGVMPTLELKDTVYYCENGKTISMLLEHQKVRAGQEPGLFSLMKYYEANLALLPDKIKTIGGSSEPAILQKMKLATIPGDERNEKVVTTGDMERFCRRMEAR